MLGVLHDIIHLKNNNHDALLSHIRFRTRMTLLCGFLHFCVSYGYTNQEPSSIKSFPRRFLIKIDFSPTEKVVVVVAHHILMPCLVLIITSKRIEQLTSTWAHFKEETQLFKMSPSWSQLLNSFRSDSPPKLMILLRKYNIYPSLCSVLTFKEIEQLTSTWAHFKEQTQLFWMSQSWES